MEIIDLRKFKDPVILQVTCRICKNTYLIKVERADYEKFEAGEGHVQDIFPYLSAADRELLISQTCGTCWDKLFNDF